MPLAGPARVASANALSSTKCGGWPMRDAILQGSLAMARGYRTAPRPPRERGEAFTGISVAKRSRKLSEGIRNSVRERLDRPKGQCSSGIDS